MDRLLRPEQLGRDGGRLRFGQSREKMGICLLPDLRWNLFAAPQEELERWLKQVCQDAEFPEIRLEYHTVNSNRQPRQQHRRVDGPATISPHFGLTETEVSWQTAIPVTGPSWGMLQVRTKPGELLSREFLRACRVAEQISRMADAYVHLLSSWQSLLSQEERHSHASQQTHRQAVQQIVENSLTSLLQLTSFQGVALFLLNETGTALCLKHYLHESLEPVPYPQRELLLADYDRQALLEGGSQCSLASLLDDNWLPAGVQQGGCVRVNNQVGPIGTLWGYYRQQGDEAGRDLSVQQAFAAQLGVIFERAVQTLNHVNHRRLKTELRLAAVTQPAKVIRHEDALSRLQAYGQCLSQFDVGGDLCEVLPLDADTVFVVVGDASGNSIPAAMVMTAVRGAVHALISDRQEQTPGQPPLEPARFMRQLNRALANMIASHQFMSCVCGLFDLPQQTFVFCNAGHPAPVLLSQGQVIPLLSHGLLLGIDEAAEYQQSAQPYQPGDVFVFYSDGISEAVDASHQQFRQQGIVAAAQTQLENSPQEIVAAIWQQVTAHQSLAQHSDDATLLAVKLGGRH